MILGLSHISLSTNSLKKVHDFYIKKLGLKVIHKFTNKNKEIYGYFISANNNTFLEFFNSKKKINFKNKNNKFRHLCFEVTNISKVAKKFNKSINIERGKTDNILQFFTKDFEGNIVEFHQRDKKSKF